MQSGIERIEYRLPDGYVFDYTIDHSIGITTEHIDRLVCLYFEHIGDLPEAVFIRTDLFAGYMRRMMNIARYNGPNSSSGMNSVNMWLSVGQVPVKTIPDAYIPLLIGSQKDYDDNNINWLFEDIVLKDCERE
jgi:hypothetical protein